MISERDGLWRRYVWLFGDSCEPRSGHSWGAHNEGCIRLDDLLERERDAIGIFRCVKLTRFVRRLRHSFIPSTSNIKTISGHRKTVNAFKSGQWPRTPNARVIISGSFVISIALGLKRTLAVGGGPGLTCRPRSSMMIKLTVTHFAAQFTMHR